MITYRFNMMNNAKTRNSRSVSQEKEIYSDLTEHETIQSINMSNKEKLSGKPYSYRNRSFKGNMDHSHSSSYKFRKKNHSRNNRMSAKIREYGMMEQNDIIKEQYYDHNKEMVRQISNLNGDNYDDLSDDLYDEDMEEICAIHRKELDMVCLEPDCETPVCSKCILVGDHKNHKYVEKENFFKSLNKDKSTVLNFQGEIQNYEQQLTKKNANPLILQHINEQRESFNHQIEAHCAKVIRTVEARRKEVEREIKIYFEQLGEKLGNYVEETIDVTQTNKDWKRQLDDALRQLNENDNDIESGFHFRKLNKRLKFVDNAKLIISNIKELQILIDKKISECLGSFKLTFNEVDGGFLEISKTDVSFKQDLRERMRICYQQIGEKIPLTNNKFSNVQNNFLNMVDDYQDNNARDTDLMNDDFDQNINMSSDLPEFGMKPQSMYPMQMNPSNQQMGMGMNNNFAFRKNPSMVMKRNSGHGVHGTEYGKIKSSVFINNEDNFYSNSNMNNPVPMDFKDRNNRSRSINKNAKSKKHLRSKNKFFIK